MASNDSRKSPFGGLRFSAMWLYGLVILVLVGLYMWDVDPGINKEISWSEFQKVAQRNAFSQITVDRQEVKASAKVSTQMRDSITVPGITPAQLRKVETFTLSTQLPSVDKFDDFYTANHLTAKVVYQNSKSTAWNLLMSFGPILLLVFFWLYIMRRSAAGAGGGAGAIFSVGKSRAQLHDKKSISVTFADVAGLHEAKEEVEEIVHFLRNPQKYTQLGGKIPKGALLVGPPGTGKTLLAKAVAGEANVPFFSLSGSDFVEMIVGVGASRVRDLFQQAKEKAPCIIFIDEIDAVGRSRGRNNNIGGNDERENTLNQLLTEMDGFGTNRGIIVIAATNRVDILDEALTRAGRFDRQIYVDLPDLNDRKEIFMVHLRPLKTDSSLDIDLLARQTPGFSGADIANVCNEAALIAARADKDFVDKSDFMNAVDRIIGGLEKKNKITTVEERESIAIHEAGHATVSWFLQYANPLVKVTIVPRGKALGAAWYLPEERQITITQALLDQMCATLAGRAAEEVFLGRVSTGAANDLERITQLAYAMVAYYGMSDKLPNLNYSKLQSDGYGFSKPYSESTAELIDKEVKDLIAEQYERAKSILREHAAGHKELSDLLISREVIYTEDVERIFGKRPWASRSEEILQQEQALAEQAGAVEKTSTTAEGEIQDIDTSTSELSPRDSEMIDESQLVVLGSDMASDPSDPENDTEVSSTSEDSSSRLS